MEFKEAIEWGEKGKDLKDKTDVDTKWSTEHHLALARRDFGQPDLAMVHFLHDMPIEKVLDPEEFDDLAVGGTDGPDIGPRIASLG
jgi:hypothetical protein